MKTYMNKKDFWISSSGYLGRSFSFNTLDLEIEDNLEPLLDNLLKSLSQNVRMKMSLFQEALEKIPFQSSRTEALKERGFLKTLGFIHFEHRKKISFKEALRGDVLKKEEFLIKRLSEIYESIDEGFLNKASALPVSSTSFNDLYWLVFPLEITSLGLKSRESLLGILKLKNSGSYPVSLRTLTLALEKVPKPLGFHISIEKMNALNGEKTLKSKSREEAEGRDQVSFEKYRNTQKALSDVKLAGEELCHYEVHITLKRLSEANLRRDVATSLKALAPLGEWSVETFGAYPSLLALSPGERLHYKLIEKSSTLKCYLPCSRFGTVLEKPSGGLLYHRRDSSLDLLNPFSQNYSNHTGVIIGKSGSGKSVFGGLLTKSLLLDSRTSIFLVDVRGSHKRTVKELNGKTYNIDIKNQSGLNPLKNLNTAKEEIEIASHFIETLLLEEGEVSLPDRDKNRLDNSLMLFAEKAKHKTLDSFYKTFKPPRKEKLARWIKGSLNENIFSTTDDLSKERLIYFNFENISTASNSYMAKAVIAAIMAEFSFKLLKKPDNEKFILISDETPFFIKSCFNTFSLLSKNVRKLNGSLILLAQNSKDLILNGDTSLIDNSEFKVLFSYDGEEKKFKEIFSLTNGEYQKLKNIHTIKGQFSQFLLKDSLGSKIGFLRLSKEEYTLSNTEPEFLHKLQNLKKLLNITEEKALRMMRYV